jgi:hypothetical protein
LSGCDALSRALDVAAGASAALSGDEPALVDRIDTEYSRYFTPTGRPTGEWAAARDRLAQSEAAVSRYAEDVAEVDGCVGRHAQLSERLVELAAERADAQQRLTAAAVAAAVVVELTAELTQAELVAAAADATARASAAALAERHRLHADVETRVTTVAELESEATLAVEEQSVARDVERAAAAAAQQSASALALAQATVDAAHAARLAARLAKIDAVQVDLARAEQQLGACLVSDAVLRDIEVAAAAVERASDKAALASARIELTALADVELRVQGDIVSLASGETYSIGATATTNIDVPGVLAAQVIPGVSASDSQATLDAAQVHLGGLLEAAGTADLAAARAAAEARRCAVSERDRLVATLAGLCGDDAVEELRSRLAASPASAAADQHTDVDAATAAHREAIAQCQQARTVAGAAAASLAEKTVRATVLQESLTAARTDLGLARQLLAQQRGVECDADLEARVRTDAEQSRHAAGSVAELRTRLAELGAERVKAELSDAKQGAAELSCRYEAMSTELRDLSTQLHVYGTEGRRGRLDAAESERAYAQSEYDRVGRRARAAERLRAVFRKHRDNTRLRYVEPFRTEVQRLGRLVFGEDFELEIDSSLRICSRTLGGRTVPYESLSGGAKEQLGIVARLAGAALVSDADRVPVIIDDALGFTDSDRLTKMGAVFGAVGAEAQVLVLTCNPHRYDSVDGAHHIELSA